MTRSPDLLSGSDLAGRGPGTSVEQLRCVRMARQARSRPSLSIASRRKHPRDDARDAAVLCPFHFKSGVVGELTLLFAPRSIERLEADARSFRLYVASGNWSACSKEYSKD